MHKCNILILMIISYEYLCVNVFIHSSINTAMLFYVLFQPVKLWTGKQVIGLLLCPNKRSNILINLRTKGKQYTANEDMCFNDSC